MVATLFVWETLEEGKKDFRKRMNPSWRLWDWRMIWRSQLSRQRSHSSRLKRFKGLQERAQKMPRTFFVQEEASTRVLILRKTHHGNTSAMMQLNSQCSASVLSREIYKGFRGWGLLKVHLDTSIYMRKMENMTTYFSKVIWRVPGNSKWRNAATSIHSQPGYSRPFLMTLH